MGTWRNEWKGMIGFLVFLVSLLIVVAIATVYFPSSDLRVSAKYQNATTLEILFADQDGGLFSTPILETSKHIDRLEIILDGQLIENIPGSIITSGPYTYQVSNNRHDLLVQIYGKDGSIHEHKFSNLNLERG